MTHAVARRDAVLELRFSGVVDVDEAVTAVGRCRDADPDLEAAAMFVDVTAVDVMDFDVAALHRLAREIRTVYGRGATFRIAYVGASQTVGAVLEAFGDVRNLMTGRLPADMPTMQLFTDADEARRWLVGSD